MGQTIFFKKIENTTVITTATLWRPTDTQLNEDTEIKKHGYFNHLTVHNDSDQDVEVRLHGDNVTDVGVEVLHAGSTIIWDAQESISYTRPAIYNKGSLDVAANKIIMILRKVV